MNTVAVKELEKEQGANADPFGIDKLLVKDLKLQLKERGLPITGLKTALKEPLLQYMRTERGNEDGTVEDNELCEADNTYDTVEDDELCEAVV